MNHRTRVVVVLTHGESLEETCNTIGAARDVARNSVQRGYIEARDHGVQRYWPPSSIHYIDVVPAEETKL